MDAAERGQLMLKLADLVEQNTEELAALDRSIAARRSTTRLAIWQASSTPWAIMPDGPTRLRVKLSPFPRSFLTTRSVNRSASWAKLFRWNFPLLMLAWKWSRRWHVATRL